MKRYRLAAMGLAACLMSMTAFAQTDLYVETVWISGHSEETDTELITVRYDCVMLADAMRTDIVPAQTALDEIDTAQISQAKEYQAWYEERYSTYIADGGAPEDFVPCSYYASANVKRCDEAVVSVLYKMDAYAGGAHPNSWYAAYNYDAVTGLELTIDEVVTDTDQWFEMVKSLLKKYYPTLDASTLDGYSASDLMWTLDSDGMTIYFGDYILGALYDGNQTLHIPYIGNSQLFRSSIQNTPLSWEVAFGNYEPAWIDADDDGVREELSVGMNTGEGTEANNNRYLLIAYAGNTLQKKLPECTALYRTLLRDGSRMYLYLQAEMDMDVAWSAAYELTGSEIRYAGDDVPSSNGIHVSHQVIQYPLDLSDLSGSAEEIWGDFPYFKPFYGVWISASRDWDAAQALAERIQADGCIGTVYVSSQWSNLNQDTWFVVSAGEHETYEEALVTLERIRSAGYTDAYIRYSGDYQG